MLIGIAWDGGFLDETRIRLNDSFNVLIGGRGTGKSTMIESLRYALGIEAVGDQAKAEHEAMVKSREVLGGGTRVSILVECRTPHVERFIIERSVPNPPVVKTLDGQRSDHRPEDLIGGVEVYGQRELAELTRDKKKLTNLLGKYLPRDDRSDEGLRKLLKDLRTSRVDILALTAEIAELAEELSTLPNLRARLKQFDDAGVAQQLEAQDKIQTEEGVLDQVQDGIDQSGGIPAEIRASSLSTEIFELDDDVE